MAVRPRFSDRLLAAIDESSIIGIRAGGDHRFIGIWAVVVERRVFVRSWSLKPRSWYRTFLEDPIGAIQVGTRRHRVRAVRVRSDRLKDAVSRAYLRKYTTPGSVGYARGFRSPRRRNTTTELVPLTPAAPK
jgi:hypothetical protein